MRPVHASLYDVDCDPLEWEEGVLALSETTLDWIRAKYRRKRSEWGEAELQFPEDGSSFQPLDGHSISGRLTSGDGYVFRGVEWRHPDDQDSTLTWISQVAIAAVDGRVQFHCTVGIESDALSLKPIDRPVGRPLVVRDLLFKYSTSLDGWPVSKSVKRIAKADVQSFVTEVLENPNRRLPVVVISPGVWSSKPEVDPEVVQSDLLGLAEVFVLDDKFAAFELTEEAGRLLSCFDGAVRLYWPGFTKDDRGKAHPLYMASAVRRFRDRGTSWSRHMAGQLQRMGLQSFAFSDVAAEAKSRSAREQRRREGELAELAEVGAADVKEVVEALKETWDREDQLTTQRDELKEKVEHLQAQVSQLQYAMDFQNSTEDAADSSADEDLESLEFRDVGDAVLRAQEQFGDQLLFLPTAIESAKDSPFSRPREVYLMLRGIAQVVSQWQDGEGSLGRTWEQAAEEHGVDWRSGISQTSESKWGDQYTFEYEGQRHLFACHVTLGAKSADSCLSAHFHRDNENLVLVVGWCGRHLRNTKT